MFKRIQPSTQVSASMRVLGFNIPFARHNPPQQAVLEQQQAGNANLINAFGRTYGALLALADHGITVIRAELDNDNVASLEIAEPNAAQRQLFCDIRSKPVDRNTPDEGWLHMADIGSFEFSRSDIKGVIVWWSSKENLPC